MGHGRKRRIKENLKEHGRRRGRGIEAMQIQRNYRCYT
jgi:hypothetical protein